MDTSAPTPPPPVPVGPAQRSIVPGMGGSSYPPITGPSDGAWAFGSGIGSHGGRSPDRAHRARGPIALTLVVFVIVASGGYWLLNRPSGGGTALALSFAPGQTERYRIDMSFSGSMDAAGRSTPFSMQVAETFSWKVASVDAGVATVEMTVEQISGNVNGQPTAPAPSAPVTLRIASDGRILTGGGFGGIDATDPIGAVFDGTDQFVPLLPDHPVSPGDTWTKAYDQVLPFDMGRLHFSSTSHLLRYEPVDGVRAAVVTSRATLPMDMAIDLRKVLESLGQDADLPEGVNPSMTFGGGMDMRLTSWLDAAHGRVVRTAGTIDMHITIDMEGFPAVGGDSANGHFALGGILTMNVDRQATAPGGSPDR